MATNVQVIARTRDRAKAEQTARMLAGASGRCLGTRKYDARTWEVVTQTELPVKEYNALVALTKAFHNLPRN